MTVRERVIATRLIRKIENYGGYAKQIGLTYKLKPEKNKGFTPTANNGV